MNRVRKYPFRTGTSVVEFENRFPDSLSCLEHILACRLGDNKTCSKCGMPTEFCKVRTANRYIPKCCWDSPLYPLRSTIFSATHIPLNIWFRAILYFTNSSSGIGPDFLHKQLGICAKASIRMCKLIREHLSAIDDDIRLGRDSNLVYVAETTMKGVARRGSKSRVRFRILLATDGIEFLVLPIATGKFVQSRDLLLDRLDQHASIITRTSELKRKILNFKSFSRVKGRIIEVADDPDHLQFYHLIACGIALKRFIINSHYWVSEQHLPSYLGHFAFLYRRRQRGSSAFWDAVSIFPKFQHSP